MKQKLKKLLAGALVCMAASTSAQAELVRFARIQALGTTNKAGDIYDPRMQSPKSAHFSVDGRKLYINALEGGQTLVYSFPQLQALSIINHQFTDDNANLFKGGETTVFDYPYYNGRVGAHNKFMGKPVEMAFSHGGRFLWVPYYRRSFDSNASSPSAVAIIDTKTDQIVRVMPTGPLPKYVAISPDSKQAVITHWGDNTLGALDISSNDPDQFKYTGHWVVEQRLPTAGIAGNRDSNCGYCLRGTSFTPDGKTLLVARMGGGGIAGFETTTGRYLGTVVNTPANPRHLVIGKNGAEIFISGNQSGVVGRYTLPDVVAALYQADGQRVAGPQGRLLAVGTGARTIELSPDQKNLYVAVNNQARLVKVDLDSWRVVDNVAVDPFTVGLAVSPDGQTIATTSQGRTGQGGGQSVGLYRN